MSEGENFKSSAAQIAYSNEMHGWSSARAHPTLTECINDQLDLINCSSRYQS